MTRTTLWTSLLAMLFIAYFRNWLWRMGLIATSQWGGDWSHALLIPLISAWLVVQRRHELARTPAKTAWPGLLLMLLGMAGYAWWIYPGRNDMLQGYSMILSLLGLVWFVHGGARTRLVLPAILYLVLAVKVSDRWWDQLAWPLQLLAARCAAGVLNIVGLFIDLRADVHGATIDVTALRGGVWISHALTVAEACSGLRMLAAFVALAAAVAFLTPKPFWQRAVLLAISVPVAVAVNIGRVTVLGLLVLFDADLTQGEFHQFVGLLMLVPALGLFMLCGWVLDKLVIYEPTDTPAISAPPATPDPRLRFSASPLPLTIATTLLALAALGLSSAIAASKTVLIKQPIALRQPLYLLPRELGAWRMTHEDPPLSPDVLQTLGTTQYLSRTYQRQVDQATVRLHLAYYTGTPDTVPHVPERCFVAAGAAPLGRDVVTLTLSDGRQFDATAFAYQHDGAEPDAAASHVLYFFSANGRLLATPDLVRLQGFSLTDRYSYYCKIELGLPGISDIDQARQQAQAFLDVLLPQVLACLPDFEALRTQGSQHSDPKTP